MRKNIFMFSFRFQRIFAAIIFILLMLNVSAQDKNVLLKQAKDFELKFDEPNALEKYKEIVMIDFTDISSLVKCAELNCSIGERQKDKKVKAMYFDSAALYAQKLNLDMDKQNASNANYVWSLVAFKKTEVEDDNKKLIDDIKQMKKYADWSLADANNAKANFLSGMWHYNLIKLNWIKKAPIKNFCVCIPDTQLDSAAAYMEKCKTIDPYYSLNYLELAKVYQDDNQPGKAIDVLNKLVKLPNRTFDDAAIKEEGKRMLAEMQ